jgi:hypothetical protein
MEDFDDQDELFFTEDFIEEVSSQMQQNGD